MGPQDEQNCPTLNQEDLTSLDLETQVMSPAVGATMPPPPAQAPNDSGCIDIMTAEESRRCTPLADHEFAALPVIDIRKLERGGEDNKNAGINECDGNLSLAVTECYDEGEWCS